VARRKYRRAVREREGGESEEKKEEEEETVGDTVDAEA